MKILFVVHDLGFADHIAIAHLSSVAKELNHLTFFCSLDRNDFLATVKEVRPDVVAYSVNILGYRRTIEAHKEATKIHEFVSIMGGPQATYSPETFPESGVDAYCVGEGEYAFRDFLLNIDNFDNVENIITKRGANPIRPLISNLDELPPADRDLVIGNSFLRYASRKTFYATRGCPFNCAYCCNNYYHSLYRGKGPIVRRFSVERLIREIEDVRDKYRMDFVKFGDDCFTIKADDWLEEFAEEYSERIGIPFNCFLRVDTLDDNMLGLLKKAGCFSVHLSVDSVSRYVRETILHRQMRSENIAERLRKIKEYGINTSVNYMLAVPGSTLQDDLDTIKQSREAKITYPTYTTTVPMEKTELYDYCVQRGFIDSAYQGDLSNTYGRSMLPCFTEKEKDVSYNIFLLGPLAAKLPHPLDKIALFLIKVIPPNIFFKKLSDCIFYYYIENKVFKVSDNLRIPRFWKREVIR